MAIHRASQTSSHALTARAFGAHGGGRCQVWAVPTPGTFLPRTARMRAVLYEKTTLGIPSAKRGSRGRLPPCGGCPHVFLFSPPPKAAKKTLQQPWMAICCPGEELG